MKNSYILKMICFNRVTFLGKGLSVSLSNNRMGIKRLRRGASESIDYKEFGNSKALCLSRNGGS